MHRSHIASADDRRQPRRPLADGDGWINPRIIRIPAASRGRGRISAASRGRGRIPTASRVRGRISAGSRRRSRDDEGLIHHLWLNICRSSIGEPAGSVGDSPPTGGVIGGEGGATPTRYIAGGEGGASSSGVLSGVNAMPPLCRMKNLNGDIVSPRLARRCGRNARLAMKAMPPLCRMKSL
ncbi:hypothetical protein SASPL_146774 [Salvia splendens]|uniref:Uncharacterized protein n=1 Tax=Salvia splendens TaxID=180675 RepID=A0A8X8WCH5_SALSN|nr:hypothetical protein SASPL_146774 [Salvia splendens]